MADVFISYSRRDKAFVRALCHALQAHDHQLWVDWDGIRSSLPWQEEILNGIRQATRLVYVLSPDALGSKYCNWEIDQALQLQKKLIPVLCRDVTLSTVRPEIASLQFIPFCGEDDFPTALEKLKGAISADLDYDRLFAKLAQRAQEWVNRDLTDGWLRGADLEEAETWLATSTGKTPAPTTLQREFILASRQERQQELERWESLYKTAEQRRITAEQNEITAFCKSSEAYFALNRPFDALLEALQAGKRLQQADWIENGSPLISQGIGVLQQALYWVREYHRLEGHHGTVRAVSLSPDGEFMLTCSRDTTIRLWRRDGHCLAVLKGHEKMVRTVAFSPDGQSFVSGSWDQTVRIWSQAGQELRVLRDHSGRINQIAFSPDGQYFASASGDGTVKLWQHHGQLIYSFDHKGIEQFSVTFSPDGQTIASGGADGNLCLWSLTGQLRTRLTLSSRAIRAVCFSANGQKVIAAGRDGVIRIWNSVDHQTRVLVDQGSEIRDIKLVANEDKLVTASTDGNIYIWNRDGSLDTTLQGHSGPCLALEKDASGEFLFSAGAERVVRLWRWRAPQLIQCQLQKNSLGLSFNPKSDQLVVCGPNEMVQIWHRQGHLLKQFVAHSSKLLTSCMSPQGDLIATAGRSNQVKLWTPDGELQAVLQGHTNWLQQLSFSPSGQLLASASEDGTVRLWKRDGHLYNVFQAAGNRFTSVQFSPDGDLIAAGSREGILTIWHCDGTLTKTLAGHDSEITEVAFTPNGQHIVSAGDDRTIRIWHLDGTLVRTVQCSRAIRTLAVSPDGKLLATGCRDGVIRLWSMEGVLLSALETRNSYLLRVCFSPDGAYLVTTGGDGILSIWQMDQFDDGLLDRLMQRGLNWCRDYLTHNPNGQAYNLLPDDPIRNEPALS